MVKQLIFYKFLKKIGPLRVLVSKLKRFIGRYREDIWFLEGRECLSKQPLSVLFSGDLNSRNYIKRLIFGDSPVKVVNTSNWRSRGWNSRLLKLASTSNERHDMAILELDMPSMPTVTEAPMFRIPCWIGGEKSLHAAAEISRRSTQIKSDIRRIRKSRLKYRVTSDPDEFDQFYYSMYLPHIQRVFGDHAYLMRYKQMQEAIPHCELFIITQDGEDIAGGILVYDGSEIVKGWSTGVKDGDHRWVRKGALAALEYLQTDYLLEKGFSRYHTGGSRPFLKDGVLCFKKNRGMKIVDNTDKSFLILPVKDCAGLRGFLVGNPFIYEDQGKLKGAVFTSSENPSEDDIARLFHDLYIPGLEYLTLFRLSKSKHSILPFHEYGTIDASGMLNTASK